MKKLVLSALLTIGCGVYGFATNSIEIQTQGEQKEETAAPKKTVQRYDFSLFKFVKPMPKVIKKDSSKISEDLLRRKSLNDETTYHQEKPRSFFTFSYAS